MTANNHPTSNVSPLTSHVTEDEINLLDYWRVLVKRKLPDPPPDILIHSKHIPASAGGEWYVRYSIPAFRWLGRP